MCEEAAERGGENKTLIKSARGMAMAYGQLESQQQQKCINNQHHQQKAASKKKYRPKSEKHH